MSKHAPKLPVRCFAPHSQIATFIDNYHRTVSDKSRLVLPINLDIAPQVHIRYISYNSLDDSRDARAEDTWDFIGAEHTWGFLVAKRISIKFMYSIGTRSVAARRKLAWLLPKPDLIATPTIRDPHEKSRRQRQRGTQTPTSLRRQQQGPRSHRRFRRL